ncbi:MAG: hypothetical protein LWY06_19265 [Firmicutes bacterium]|nr:hypothetical protein [Bacillota bacterium]
MYFDIKGKENTDKALEIAFSEAKARGVGHIVIASTWGGTAEKAAALAKNYPGIKVVIVTHNTGFKTPGVQEFNAEIRAKLEGEGVAVLSGTMPTRTIGRAIKDKTGFSQEDICCASWRMFGEGTKVCIEIAGMACDAGLVPPEDIIVVAGSGSGSDTVILMNARSSHEIFSVKIREILAKPRDW